MIVLGWYLNVTYVLNIRQYRSDDIQYRITAVGMFEFDFDSLSKYPLSVNIIIIISLSGSQK